MQVRCPHCHHSIELGSDSSLEDISCSCCGSRFSLVGADTVDYGPERHEQIGQFEFLDKLGLSGSILENAIHRFMAVPASRRLRMKRSVGLLVVDRDGSGTGDIVEGTYQSPILIQWQRAASQSRLLRVDFIRYE